MWIVRRDASNFEKSLHVIASCVRTMGESLGSLHLFTSVQGLCLAVAYSTPRGAEAPRLRLRSPNKPHFEFYQPTFLTFLSCLHSFPKRAIPRVSYTRCENKTRNASLVLVACWPSPFCVFLRPCIVHCAPPSGCRLGARSPGVACGSMRAHRSPNPISQ